ncbi:MAG: HAD family hydrolase [Oscillospiraceae bacterium]|jgi:phosphoglycolate phosphatase|nr:HAD family hydrolase [Oscillospiraceae bacterium]
MIRQIPKSSSKNRPPPPNSFGLRGETLNRVSAGGTNKYKHVIWDWNGTIIDDVDWCVRCMNTMLARRGLPQLSGTEQYRSVFCFPVIEYYKKVGFDFEKEPFEALAEEYISLYQSEDSDIRLYPGVETVLQTLAEHGARQTVLSASEQQNLFSQLRRFSIEPYFEAVLGISDIYAGSKVERAKEYLSGAETSRVLVIGDTSHDAEVARELGADCVLVACGHEGRASLLQNGVPVLASVSGVLDLFRQ